MLVVDNVITNAYLEGAQVQYPNTNLLDKYKSSITKSLLDVAKLTFSAPEYNILAIINTNAYKVEVDGMFYSLEATTSVYNYYLGSIGFRQDMVVIPFDTIQTGAKEATLYAESGGVSVGLVIAGKTVYIGETLTDGSKDIIIDKDVTLETLSGATEYIKRGFRVDRSVNVYCSKVNFLQLLSLLKDKKRRLFFIGRVVYGTLSSVEVIKEYIESVECQVKIKESL